MNHMLYITVDDHRFIGQSACNVPFYYFWYKYDEQTIYSWINFTLNPVMFCTKSQKGALHASVLSGSLAPIVRVSEKKKWLMHENCYLFTVLNFLWFKKGHQCLYQERGGVTEPYLHYSSRHLYSLFERKSQLASTAIQKVWYSSESIKFMGKASTKSGKGKQAAASKKSKAKETYVDCPYTDQKVWISKATLKDLNGSGNINGGSHKKRLWTISSSKIRQDHYADVAQALSIYEQELLPSSGGRSWEVFVTLSEPNARVLFRSWKGKFEVSCHSTM